jgi:hypothetical protein
MGLKLVSNDWKIDHIGFKMIGSAVHNPGSVNEFTYQTPFCDTKVPFDGFQR